MQKDYGDLTYIKQIDGKWYAFAGEYQKNQVYSIGHDNPKGGRRWFASWTNSGIQYVATASPNRSAAYHKAHRNGIYCGAR